MLGRSCESHGKERMAKVAFIGLGVMGYPMAGHLAQKGGHETAVYNRTAEKARKWADAFGGRAAEEIIYGPENVTTGASNDIQQATNMARAMVMEYGMSDKLGRLRYRQNQEEVFLGHSVSQQQNMSEDTARLIDQEVRAIIEVAENKARQVLQERIDELHTLTNGLLEYETLSGDEVRDLLAGKPLARDMGDDTPPSRGSAVPKVGTAKPLGPRDRPEDGLEPQPSA